MRLGTLPDGSNAKPVLAAAPARRPGSRVNVVVKPGGLAIAHLPDVRERSRHVATTLGFGAELSDDDDVITESLEETVRPGAELVEVLRNRAEHVVRNAPRTLECTGGRASSAGLVPLIAGSMA